MGSKVKVVSRRVRAGGAQGLLCSASLGVLALALGLSAPALAADLNWDGNGQASNAGGAGSWNTSAANWSETTDGVSGSFHVWNNSSLDNAVFGQTAGVVSLGAPITAHNLTFNVHNYTLTGGTLTLGGATPTIGGAGNATINSVIAGTAGLKKAGTGVLTLGGANTFTGNVDVTGGTLTLTHASALGNASNVVNLSAGTVLNSGVALTGRTVNLLSGQAIVQGQAGSAHLTGAGSLRVDAGVTLSDATNDFTGNVVAYVDDGTANFTSIANAGVASAVGAGDTITILGQNHASYAGERADDDFFSYTGAGPASTNRKWIIQPQAPAGGPSGEGVHIGNASSNGGKLTLTGDIEGVGTRCCESMGLYAGTGDIDALGVISSNNARPVEFWGGGIGRTITLGAQNTFTGAAIIGTATVKASSIQDIGVASSLGAGSLITVGGVLSYTGGSTITNRTWTFSNGSSLLNDGAGAMTLGGAVTLDPGMATLGGGYTGANTIAGVISGAGGLTIDGAGAWALDADNTFTGAVKVKKGTLRAARTTALAATTDVTVDGGVLDLNGANLSLTKLAGVGGEIKLGGGGFTLDVANNTTQDYAGSITGSGALTKNGLGTLTLTGASSFTGPTTLNAGTLKLDFSSTTGPTRDIMLGSSVKISGGSTLLVQGGNNETNIQTVAGLNITGGINTVKAVSGSGGSLTLDLGVINRTAGLVNFVLPTSGNIQTDSTALGGWAMINNTDYAKVVGRNILPFDVSDYTYDDDAATWQGGKYIAETDGGDGFFNTVGSSVQLAGLRYTEPKATIVTVGNGVTLGVDGTILVSSDVAANDQLITGGSIRGAANGALSIQQGSAGNFAIASTIIDNAGATGFIKSGTGLVTVSGVNTYTGATTVLQGVLAVNSIGDGGADSAIGKSSAASSNLVIDAGTLRYTAGTVTSNRGFTLTHNNVTTGAIDVQLAGTDLTFTGQVTSPDDAGLTKIGLGRLTLTNATNNYVGPTVVSGGVLAVSSIGDAGAPSTLGASAAAAANLVLNGGRLAYTGTDATASTNRGFQVGGVTGGGTGGIIVQNAATTLTVSGASSGSGLFTKEGSGTLILSGTNTYSGGTTVSAGVLRAGSAQAFGGQGLMTVAPGATLQLNNFNNTVGSLAGGGSVALGSGRLTLAGGASAFGGVIGGTGGLTVNGAVQTINGCNQTYAGFTLLDSGTLSTDCLKDGGLASGVGASGAASTNLQFAGGRLTYTGTSIGIDRGFTLGTGGGIVNVFNGATTLEFKGQVTGAGGLTKEGAGTLIISHADNSYTGGTQITGGVVKATVANTLGRTTDAGGLSFSNVAGAVFDMTNLDQTVAFLSGGGANGGGVVLGAGALTLRAPTSQTYAGAISGAGALVKNGAGLQVLSGCRSSYAGATTIGAGVLRVDCLADGLQNSAIGASTADSANLIINGTLEYTGPTSNTDRLFTLGTTGGALNASGSGPITFSNTGAVVLSGADTARMLTLGGTNTGDNSLGAQLTDNGAGKTSLTKTNGGTWILTNPGSTYTGATTISGGVLGVSKLANGLQPSSLGASSNLASNLVIGGGGTLRYTGAGDSSDRLFSLSAGIATIEAAGAGAVKFANPAAVTLQTPTAAHTLVLTGANSGDNTIGGSIGDGSTVAAATRLTKNGAGKWVLTGANTYTGDTNINSGVLVIGDGGTTGALASRVANVANIGVLGFNRSDSSTYDGEIRGAGSLQQLGTGKTTLTGANTYTGGTTIGAGTLELGAGGATGSIVGNVTNNGALTFNRNNQYNFTGLVSGSGQLRQIGSGTTVLSANNSYMGATEVTAGTLRINGNQSAATGLTTVFTGATLGGSGTIGGSVLVQNGGVLSPGNSPGTLTINGDLTLNASSVLDMELGQADVPGGPLNDLINVGGALTLDGTLNVTTSTGGTFGPGVYRLFNYSGALTDNGLTIGSLPAGATAGIQTSVAGQVNLINGAGEALNFWDAPGSAKNDGTIQGGAGIWRVGGNTTGWANAAGTVNADYTQDSFAIFQGAPGMVTIDPVGGAVRATGLQFAVNGYSLAGSGLTLIGPQSTIVVGDGTAAGAAMTATIGAPIDGTTQLVKTDRGTLVLSGTNTYTGGTLVTGGVLQVSSDGNLGAAAGGLTLDGGTLSFSSGVTVARAVTLGSGGGTVQNTASSTLSGNIGGAGGLTKTGIGGLILTGTNTYTGGTTINGGALQIGSPSATGSIIGDVVVNSGQLIFHNPSAQTFAGLISGAGLVTKGGSNTVALTAANTYSGQTSVTAGTLLINGDQSGATGLTNVGLSGTLGGTGVIGGNVNVTTTLAPGGSAGPGTLTINGGLTLSSSAKLNYDFGQADVAGGALNDLTKVGGALTLDGTINVAQSGGGTLGPGVYRVIDYAGALTNNGLTVGTAPGGTSFVVQTSVAKQVNLVNTAGLALNFWDGAAGGRNDGAVSGGTGVWQGGGGNDNWTTVGGSANAAFATGSMAIFQGAPGLVTVDQTAGGAFATGGMQFTVDGYAITGDSLTLAGAQTIVRVGDGSPASAGVTATIHTALTGTSQLLKTDAGALVLDGADSYTGGTQIEGGTLYVNGDQTAANGLTTVNTGILAGAGKIGGDVVVNAGGAIAPGNGAGTLTIAGDLTLNAGAKLNMEFGEAGTAGGALNDLIIVGGDLTLDGTVNVALSSGGTFGPGIYRMINYTGTLTDNSLDVGTLPSGSATVQTSVANQVNLVVDSGGGPGPGPGPAPDPGPGPGPDPDPDPGPTPVYNFWDGAAGPHANGQINGGDGVWQASAGNSNWTETTGAKNGGYADRGFAIFTGAAGTVVVDTSIGPVMASGMQFAVDGYRLQGGAIALTGPEAIVRVGDGTTAGGAFRAAIDAPLTGSARLVKTDGGALVLTGANSYTGGTRIDGGTLAGSAASFGAGEIVNNATLILDQATDASFANAIGGAGALVKSGAGVLTYTGSAGLTGATDVRAGVLAVQGSLASSAVTVRNGAALAGSGTVGDVTLDAGAIVSPGAGLGGLNVNGDFAQASGATYLVEIDPQAATSDRLVVGGAAALAPGAALRVVKAGTGAWTPGQSYTVLTAAHGVTGSYDLTGDAGRLSAFLSLEATYAPTAVNLTIAQTRALEDAAQTPNQAAAADAADSLPAGDPVRTALVNLPTDGAAQTAFDRLSGEVHASLKGVLNAQSGAVREAVLTRLRTADCARQDAERLEPACADDRAAGWAQVLGAWGDVDGDRNAVGLDHSSAGFLLGFDAPAGDWRLGAFAGYSRATWSLDAGRGSGDSDDYHVGAYGGRRWGPLGVKLGAGYTRHDVSTGRAAVFPGLAETLKADYDADAAQAFVDVGYLRQAGALALEPFANLAHTRLHVDGFSETGGSAALTASGDTMQTTVTTLGVRPSTEVALGSVQATLRGMVAWRHAFGDLDPQTRLGFSGGERFEVRGAPIARDAAALEAGVDVPFADGGLASFSYGGQFGDGTREQRVRLDVRLRF